MINLYGAQEFTNIINHNVRRSGRAFGPGHRSARGDFARPTLGL